MSGEDKICRVCECDEDLEQIFLDHTSDVAEKLMLCAAVQVEAEDQLPQYICSKCCERLDLAYEFKIQCENTDTKLRRLALRNKLKKPQFSREKLTTVIATDELDEFCLEEFDDVEELIEVEDIEFKDEDEEASIKNEYYVEDLEGSTGRNMMISIEAHYEKEDIQNSNEGDDHNSNEENDHNSNEEDEVYLVKEEVSIDDKEHSGMSDNYLIDDISNADECREIKEEEQKKSTDLKQKRGKSVISEKMFVCDTCNEAFNTFTEFNQHKKSHGDKRYQCPICMKWFSRKYRLKNHMSTHVGSKDFACEICGNKYTNQGNLDRHIRHFHKKERPYMCNQCGLSFSRSNILKLHLTVHIKERNYECEICNKRFKAEYYLKLHKKSHIPIEERRQKIRKPRQGKEPKTFSCSYCDKVLASRAVHASHVRTHTGEKPFECSTCHRRFAFRQSLKSHEFLHTGEKPFACELCGLTFRQVGHLKGHMLVHSGLKNHKCQYCEKSFALKSNLVVHRRLHTGETPYHCNLCEKKFYDSNGLKRHKKSHLKKQAEMSELNELVKIEPLSDFLEENSKDYSEIIEMQANGEIRIVTLNNSKTIALTQQESC